VLQRGIEGCLPVELNEIQHLRISVCTSHASWPAQQHCSKTACRFADGSLQHVTGETAVLKKNYVQQSALVHAVWLCYLCLGKHALDKYCWSFARDAPKHTHASSTCAVGASSLLYVSEKLQQHQSVSIKHQPATLASCSSAANSKCQSRT
jgi:hypothetical protein